ncbi:MAG: hypothetical protein ABWK01_07495, partial [Infirmifilum sp.]
DRIIEKVIKEGYNPYFGVPDLVEMEEDFGIIYITTRSRGFPYHAYPHDYWRYEVYDMREIFGDFEIVKLARDWLEPGVYLKARKPAASQGVESYTCNGWTSLLLEWGFLGITISLRPGKLFLLGPRVKSDELSQPRRPRGAHVVRTRRFSCFSPSRPPCLNRLFEGGGL